MPQFVASANREHRRSRYPWRRLTRCLGNSWLELLGPEPILALRCKSTGDGPCLQTAPLLRFQVFCSKQQPRCGTCPLRDICEYALHGGPRMPSPTTDATATMTPEPLPDPVPAAGSDALRGGGAGQEPLHGDSTAAHGFGASEQPVCEADVDHASQVQGLLVQVLRLGMLSRIVVGVRVKAS